MSNLSTTRQVIFITPLHKFWKIKLMYEKNQYIGINSQAIMFKGYFTQTSEVKDQAKLLETQVKVSEQSSKAECELVR